MYGVLSWSFSTTCMGDEIYSRVHRAGPLIGFPSSCSRLCKRNKQSISICFQIGFFSVYNQHSKAIINERQLCNATIVIVHQSRIQQTVITIAPYI